MTQGESMLIARHTGLRPRDRGLGAPWSAPRDVAADHITSAWSAEAVQG